MSPYEIPGAKRHPAFAKVFAPGHLTFGLIAPLEGYPDSAAPTMKDHLALAIQADKAGFAALWLRDVPLLDPGFGDAGQVFDPLSTPRYCLRSPGKSASARQASY